MKLRIADFEMGIEENPGQLRIAECELRMKGF